MIIPLGTGGSPGCEPLCFNPATIYIDLGDTLTWSNDDLIAHTVTSGTIKDGPNEIFDSSLIMGGDTFEVTFDKEGIFDYFCMVHPWMKGYVVVGGGEAIIIPTTIIKTESSELDALKKENADLRTENQLLNAEILDLKKQVTDLSEIIMEQIRIIYEWVINR